MQSCQQKAFVAKLSIAFEEADETQFWLEAIQDLKLLPVEKLSAINKEAAELASILASARKTAKANSK